jgi:hypothetical protein
MNQKIRCANPNCRRLFLPDPRVKDQRYCNKKACQRFRKRQWQRRKIKSDPDYRDDQHDARQYWMEQNRGYWHQYRDKHPEYVERNRILQKKRDKTRRLVHLAKMDASKDISYVKSISYYLIPAKKDLAKMDALSPEYILIPKVCPFLAKKDSMDLASFSDLDCTKKEVTIYEQKNHSLPCAGQ